MKKIMLLLLVVCLFTGCSLIFCYGQGVIENKYGREQLKIMKYKKSFDKSETGIIDFNSIYYYRDEDLSIDMEFNFIIRFFKDGQYAYFVTNQKPIIGLTHENIDYNDLEKATYVGYYNIKKNKVILEYPNHNLMKGSPRQLLKYKVLDNGDLDKIVSFFNSDYKTLFKKTPIPDEKLVIVVPDW